MRHARKIWVTEKTIEDRKKPDGITMTWQHSQASFPVILVSGSVGKGFAMNTSTRSKNEAAARNNGILRNGYETISLNLYVLVSNSLMKILSLAQVKSFKDSKKRHTL